MSEFRIPRALKIALWVFWRAVLLAYGLSPLFMGPVDPQSLHRSIEGSRGRGAIDDTEPA